LRIALAGEKVKTWLAGLDEALGGGFPDGCLVALVGASGMVHELFARQLLYLHVVNGGSAAYVTTRRPASDVAREMAAFGFDIEGLVKDGRWSFVEALTRSAKESLLELVKAKVEEGRWVAIDSVSHLVSSKVYVADVEDPAVQRPLTALLRGLAKASRKHGGVHFVLSTKNLLDSRSEALIEDMADWVLEFNYGLAPGRVVRQISLRTVASPVNSEVLSFRVTREGILIETAVRV